MIYFIIGLVVLVIFIFIWILCAAASDADNWLENFELDNEKEENKDEAHLR